MALIPPAQTKVTRMLKELQRQLRVLELEQTMIHKQLLGHVTTVSTKLSSSSSGNQSATASAPAAVVRTAIPSTPVAAVRTATAWCSYRVQASLRHKTLSAPALFERAPSSKTTISYPKIHQFVQSYVSPANMEQQRNNWELQQQSLSPRRGGYNHFTDPSYSPTVKVYQMRILIWYAMSAV